MAGSIEKRGENSFRLIVSGGIGVDSKRKKYTKTVKIEGKTDAEKMKKAEKELAKFITEIETNTFVEPSKMTLNSLAAKWIKEYAEKNLEPKTVFRYKELLDSRILPALGHLRILKIKPTHLLEFYNNLQENGIRNDGKEGGLSPTTILHHHRLIHAIFQSAVSWQMIYTNPADYVKPPKVKKHEAKFYDIDDIETLIKAINTLDKRDLKYKVGVFITLASGLRIGELMGLKWEHVNFDKNIISIIQANQYLPKQGTFTKDPKNYSSKRNVMLPKEVMDILNEYKTYQDKKIDDMGDLWQGEGFIFTQWDGRAMYPETMSKWFSKFITKNNLKKITFHQLRHTSASVLINEGINIIEVSGRLGHSKASTTTDIYSHVLKSADKGAADVMERIMFKEKVSEKDTE